MKELLEAMRDKLRFEAEPLGRLEGMIYPRDIRVIGSADYIFVPAQWPCVGIQRGEKDRNPVELAEMGRENELLGINIWVFHRIDINDENTLLGTERRIGLERLVETIEDIVHEEAPPEPLAPFYVNPFEASAQIVEVLVLGTSQPEVFQPLNVEAGTDTNWITLRSAVATQIWRSRAAS